MAGNAQGGHGKKTKKAVIGSKLAPFNPHWITELIVDAGPEACASFLTQVDPKDPENRVLIHVSSHAFSAAELNYSHVEKEAYACVWACIKDHLHLYGTKFNLITDNVGCQKIFEEDIPRKKIPPRLERLKSKLAVYNAKVIFRPGLSIIADYLSRRSPKIAEKAATPSKKVMVREVSEMPLDNEPYKISIDDIKAAMVLDPVMVELERAMGRNRSIRNNKRLTGFSGVFKELRVHRTGIILRNNLIVIPESLRIKAIKYAHEGHLGMVLCKRLLRNRCWWPGMDAMIECEVNDCAPCQANTDTTTHEPMIATVFSKEKLGLTSVDFSSRMPSGEYLLVVYYETGRLPAYRISGSLTSEDAIVLLTRIFNVHGIPQVLKSDNGPAFKSAEFAEFSRRLGFRHQKITPLNPEANGGCERMMGPINKAVMCAAVEGVSWKEGVKRFMTNYRSTPHSATGIPPDEYMTGVDSCKIIPSFKPKRSIEELYEIASRNDKIAKDRCKKNADRNQRAKESRFAVNNPVMHKWLRKNKHMSLFDPFPYRLKEIKGNMVTMERPGHVVVRNSRFAKKISEKCYENAVDLVKKGMKPKNDEVAIITTTTTTTETGGSGYSTRSSGR